MAFTGGMSYYAGSGVGGVMAPHSRKVALGMHTRQVNQAAIHMACTASYRHVEACKRNDDSLWGDVGNTENYFIRAGDMIFEVPDLPPIKNMPQTMPTFNGLARPFRAASDQETYEHYERTIRFMGIANRDVDPMKSTAPAEFVTVRGGSCDMLNTGPKTISAGTTFVWRAPRPDDLQRVAGTSFKRFVGQTMPLDVACDVVDASNAIRAAFKEMPTASDSPSEAAGKWAAIRDAPAGGLADGLMRIGVEFINAVGAVGRAPGAAPAVYDRATGEVYGHSTHRPTAVAVGPDHDLSRALGLEPPAAGDHAPFGALYATVAKHLLTSDEGRDAIASIHNAVVAEVMIAAERRVGIALSNAAPGEPMRVMLQ